MPISRQCSFKAILLIITTSLTFNTYAQRSIEATDTPDHYYTISVPSTDSLMNDAKLKARQTWNIFYSAYTQRGKNHKDFAVKYPFKTPTGHEHIWLTQIKIKKGKITGKINNHPKQTQEVKFREKVEISTKLISDWMFYEDGELKGAYTILATIELLPEDQKKALKERLGL